MEEALLQIAGKVHLLKKLEHIADSWDMFGFGCMMDEDVIDVGLDIPI